MSAPYKHILERIEHLSGDLARLVYDEELNTLLGPIRRYGPIRVVCGNYSCRQTVSWWALDQQIAVVLSAKRRLTKKESRGLGGPYEFKDPDPQPGLGFSLSDREATDPGQVGRKQVTLAEHQGHGVTGVTTRRVFRCGKCRQEVPRKNATMLRDFVAAAGANRQEIRL